MAKSWGSQLDDMTNNKSKAPAQSDSVPFGYVLKKDPKTTRHTFALPKSVLDALRQIANEKDVTLNSLVNDVLLEYVKNYLNED